MMVLVTYDVNTTSSNGARRLRRVAKECEAYGQRVQNSVFECVLEPAQCKRLQAALCEIIDMESDSLRFYYLGSQYESRRESFGVKQRYEPEGILIM